MQKAPGRTTRLPYPPGRSQASQSGKRRNPFVIGRQGICIQRPGTDIRRSKIHMLVNLMHNSLEFKC